MALVLYAQVLQRGKMFRGGDSIEPKRSALNRFAVFDHFDAVFRRLRNGKEYPLLIPKIRVLRARLIPQSLGWRRNAFPVGLVIQKIKTLLSLRLFRPDADRNERNCKQ